MRCAMCDAEIKGEAVWTGLNRVAIGVGSRVRLLEFNGRQAGYHWDMNSGRASGQPLCWPHCFVTYVEGMHMELKHDINTKHHG